MNSRNNLDTSELDGLLKRLTRTQTQLSLDDANRKRNWVWTIQIANATEFGRSESNPFRKIGKIGGKSVLKWFRSCSCCIKKQLQWQKLNTIVNLIRLYLLQGLFWQCHGSVNHYKTYFCSHNKNCFKTVSGLRQYSINFLMNSPSKENF